MSSENDYDLGSDQHYKHSVTNFGNKQLVTCSEDIYSDDNVKLIAKGAKVDSKVYATLIKHKLQRPLDESLATDETCSIQTIVQDIANLLAASNTLTALLDKITPSETIESLVSSHTLPENMAFKLTIAQSEHPELYKHSLVVICLCYYLTQNLDIDAETSSNTLLAALFHDIGMLHLDSALFEQDRTLAQDERKFLHAHVIVSHLLINNHECYQGRIANAVLEHHERLDGSGYPKGESYSSLGLEGQVLAIAEVIASKFDSQGECTQLEELSLLLKMNYAKLNHDIFKHWLWHFAEDENNDEPSSNYSDSRLIAQSRHLSKVINKWLELMALLPSNTLIDFIDAYMGNIHNNLKQVGMDIDDLDNLTSLLEQDKVVKQHFHIIFNESHWQLNNLVSELIRRQLFQQAQQDTQVGPWLTTVMQSSTVD